MQHYEGLRFTFRPAPEEDVGTTRVVPVVVVGAGPVGLTLALDLARRGIACVVLDDQLRLSVGSRAICFARRTLEIFDRLGVGEAVTRAGVSWDVGRVFLGGELLYQFNLAVEGGQHRPAFVNLPQYVVEGVLADEAARTSLIDLRFGHALADVTADADGVSVSVSTPAGAYALRAQYVVACDGARSTVRARLGIEVAGHTFQDRFLIADVRMRAPFPAERWFWFDPPFHRNQSALLHRQPDDLWRIDFQLGWDADPEREREPERVRQRVEAMLGEAVEFELVWVSVYTFACQRIERFVHDRIVFAGDAAHGVSPFGARGANSGIQDADNLGWKLAALLNGQAGPALLASYHEERSAAADENIRHSTRSTDFITPKTPASRIMRDACLRLAKHFAFARRLVNSGRLSAPTTYVDSPLNGPDTGSSDGICPGAPCVDAPLEVCGSSVWLLQLLEGRLAFVIFANGEHDTVADAAAIAQIRHALPADTLVLVIVPAAAALALDPSVIVAVDRDGLACERYGAGAGLSMLVRPDQHVAARFTHAAPAQIALAVRRVFGF